MLHIFWPLNIWRKCRLNLLFLWWDILGRLPRKSYFKYKVILNIKKLFLKVILNTKQINSQLHLATLDTVTKPLRILFQCPVRHTMEKQFQIQICHILIYENRHLQSYSTEIKAVTGRDCLIFKRLFVLSNN